jgi:hypothetical protein
VLELRLRALLGLPRDLSGVEGNSLVIGRPVQCTLWQVDYRYLNANHEPRPEPTGPHTRALIAQSPPDSPYVHGKLFVVTADPSGADLCQIAERAVRASGALGVTDFAILTAHRMADTLRGFAQVDERAS